MRACVLRIAAPRTTRGMSTTRATSTTTTRTTRTGAPPIVLSLRPYGRSVRVVRRDTKHKEPNALPEGKTILRRCERNLLCGKKE